MPLMKIETSVPVAAEKRNPIMSQASRILADVTSKPERYVMVVLEESDFLMAGDTGPAAFVEIRGIGGLTKTVNARLAQELCSLLERELNIPRARVYLNFLDVAATNWGWNGSTFA